MKWQRWANCSRRRAPVIKQWNLVQPKGGNSMTEKVTVGLVESNSSLPAGLLILPAADCH